MGSTLKEFAPPGANSFLKELTPAKKRRQNKEVASFESIILFLKGTSGVADLLLSRV